MRTFSTLCSIKTTRVEREREDEAARETCPATPLATWVRGGIFPWGTNTVYKSQQRKTFLPHKEYLFHLNVLEMGKIQCGLYHIFLHIIEALQRTGNMETLVPRRLEWEGQDEIHRITLFSKQIQYCKYQFGR